MTAKADKLDKIRVVPSGKVYRQLFEAEVQLVNAYNHVKEKRKENPPRLPELIDGIPLVKEGRSMRGHGFLDRDGMQWINSLSNDPYTGNPFNTKENEILAKIQKEIEKRENDRAEVVFLPEYIDVNSNGSDVETRINNSRKLKHEKAWEDMIQEVSTINISLEPLIEAAGKKLLDRLAQDDIETNEILKPLEDDETTTNMVFSSFDDIKERLIKHTENRKLFIEETDEFLLEIEDQRVEKILNVIKKYSEVLFKIYYKKEGDVERDLDNEVELINMQVLQNKITYADLNARLLTADIERERNQIRFLESKREFWKNTFFNEKYQKFLDYINGIAIPDAVNLERELRTEQKALNENRMGLLDSLKSFKPPESTKTAVYNWHDTIMQYTSLLEEVNFNYVKTLRSNLNGALQNMIEEIEKTLKWLIDNSIISESDKKSIMEKKFLPIAGYKQKELEEYVDSVDKAFDEANRVTNQQVHILFKYLQGIAHLWDIHELALIKQERSLQEMLQDLRRDHDTENQRREERLDAILDQLRESSTENNLKRLLHFAYDQLEVIKKGYFVFNENQKEIVKQYPGMIEEELIKYEEKILNYFSVSKQMPQITSQRSNYNGDENEDDNQAVDKAGNDNLFLEQQDSDDNLVKAIREKIQSPIKKKNILREFFHVLSTKRGSTFYVDTVGDNDHDSSTNDEKATRNEQDEQRSEAEAMELLALDELILKTKAKSFTVQTNESYLIDSFIPVTVYKEMRKNVRLIFINHYETWMDEARQRANTIVAAKFDEIDKELELRLHLHEPRYKRAEMDIHHVRAAELLMHEERVERHCKSVEEAMENLQHEYEGLQTKLVDLTIKFKDDILNLESDFISATKSLRLKWLQDKLVKDRQKHMDNVKTTIRHYHAKFDETLQFIRNSSAKFRKSFYLFSDGGNFSSDEVDVHKKKLEKMAILIDKHETAVLKEMEKLEKRQLEEAIKILSQFQEKFKYHLVDIEFIETVSRWLNDTQVKIKTEVAASNQYAKNLFELVANFEKTVKDSKILKHREVIYNPEQFFESFDVLNKEIYSRATYLKCLKEGFMSGHDLKAISEENFERQKSPLNDNRTQQVSYVVPGSNETVINPSFTIQGKNHKVNIEDTTVNIIRNIMHYEKYDDSDVNSASTSSKKAPSSRKLSLRKSNVSFQVPQKTFYASRRAKTRDEMYAYYCTFGAEKDMGEDFMAHVKNILRESLEGILSNAELFYREILNQNRQITRPQSIKESFSDFAEAIIAKMKSYMHQCSIYLNQSLKEFREILEKTEKLCGDIPDLIINISYTNVLNDMKKNFNGINKTGKDKLKELDDKRIAHVGKLKPSLGHPNNLELLSELDSKEKERQGISSTTIEEFTVSLKNAIKNYAKVFQTSLVKHQEMLLLKFDDILTIDDVNKHDVLPDKHSTSELLRRKMAGIPLEEPEEVLIKRGKGKWTGVDKFNILRDMDDTQNTVIEIHTAKTTLAHEKAVNTKFQKEVDELSSYVETNNAELNHQLKRGLKSWDNSINDIKKIHD